MEPGEQAQATTGGAPAGLRECSTHPKAHRVARNRAPQANQTIVRSAGQCNTYAGKWSDGKKTGSWTYYAEDGETVWRVITYKNGSRTKEADMLLGSCPQCNHYVQSPEWEICPKCGTELIKHRR